MYLFILNNACHMSLYFVFNKLLFYSLMYSYICPYTQIWQVNFYSRTVHLCFVKIYIFVRNVNIYI